MPTIADAMDDVLREHLPNEVKRLNDAFKRLLVHDLDRAMVDILIESFCIHAHNLIEFFLEETLTPKGRNAVAGARHYVGRSYTAFEGNNIRAEESYEKLKAQVDHIRYGERKERVVNGPRNLLTLGRVIFLTWRGWRSAVCVISASVFRGSTAAFDRRVRGRGLDQSIRADVLGNKIGVLTEAIA